MLPLQRRERDAADDPLDVSDVGARLRDLLERLDEHDGYVRGHGTEVSRVAARICRALELPDAEVRDVVLGALLHDLGKLFIDRRVLAKPARLTELEWQAIRLHPTLGVALLEPGAVREEVVAIIESHHERWDGAGYPHGLAGAEIPLGARIVAAADALCAMREPRAYREPLTLDDALSELDRTAWQQFDGTCVQALIDSVAA